MPKNAVIFIRTVIFAAVVVLACGVLDCKSSGVLRFLSCLIIALFFSTLKVHFPALTGTVSFSFTFVMVGVADFTFAETLAMACASALIQSLWKVKKRPATLQLLFSLATVTISAAAAWWVPRFILNSTHAHSAIVLLALAAPLYFSINMTLVTAAVALVEEKPLKNLWTQCSLWSYAYFLLQTVIAALIVTFTRSQGWFVPLCGIAFFVPLCLGFKPLCRLLFNQQPVGRKAKRYEGVISTIEVSWSDHRGRHVRKTSVIDISEWGASVECTEPISATSVHINVDGGGDAYSGLAEICYCQFKSGKYIVGIEFHRCLTRNELQSLLWTRG
jgi:hypothetical protein